MVIIMIMIEAWSWNAQGSWKPIFGLHVQWLAGQPAAIANSRLQHDAMVVSYLAPAWANKLRGLGVLKADTALVLPVICFGFKGGPFQAVS